MSLYALCPHCHEVRTLKVDTWPDDLILEPCTGCEEFEVKLEQIAEADYYEESK